jgi:threonine synthase
MGPIGVVKGFEELIELGLVDKVPALGIVQSDGCDPMIQAFTNGMPVAVPVENPTTMITTLATANPGRAYQLLWDIMQRYGGAAASASDQEAFDITRVMARKDGISVEPATAVAFAGLVKMVERGQIKPDDVVVFNCSGHTFPVEKEILGEHWAKNVDLSKFATTDVPLPRTGLLSAVGNVQNKVQKVVIIEDHKDSARLLTRILKNANNYEIFLAEDGFAGLETIRQVQPDLVITDLMMPRMDGFQVIDVLKKDENLRHIPIIVLTAKELTVQERHRLGAQIDSVLHKGTFLNEELIKSIVDALN